MEERTSRDSDRGSRWPWLLLAGGLLIVLIAVFLPRSERNSSLNALNGGGTGQGASAGVSASAVSPFHSHPPSATAEEIVARKLNQFAQQRCELVHAMAARLKLAVPAEADRFFDILEAGHWDEIDEAYKALVASRTDGSSPELVKLWSPIMESYGVAEEAHRWPAQKLLDYGGAVLNPLRPGMVYVGGTDPGRFIPTLLNETSAGEHHIVLTQNGLADQTYLEYLNFQYGDRVTTLKPDDGQHAFEDYMADAKKRLEHDQQHPDEPKQVLPGENISIENDRVQISGQVAVMAVNERLLHTFMQNNPGLSFALEESFPLKSTYPDAALLGPVMELRTPTGQNAITSQSAAQAVDFWRLMADQLRSDPETPDDSDPRKTYAKMAAAQANLLASHDFNAEAEQAYRLSMEIWAASPESVYGLADLMARSGRTDQARQLVTDFQHNHPGPPAHY